MCPRDQNGNFHCPPIYVNPWDKRYVEGDAWHWRWFVFHDMENLVSLFGKDYFAKELDKIDQSNDYRPRDQSKQRSVSELVTPPVRNRR